MHPYLNYYVLNYIVMARGNGGGVSGDPPHHFAFFHLTNFEANLEAPRGRVSGAGRPVGSGGGVPWIRPHGQSRVPGPGRRGEGGGMDHGGEALEVHAEGVVLPLRREHRVPGSVLPGGIPRGTRTYKGPRLAYQPLGVFECDSASGVTADPGGWRRRTPLDRLLQGQPRVQPRGEPRPRAP